jgi:hypothetical protein
MRKKGLVYRGTILFGWAIVSVSCFGGALWARWNDDTPEGQGESDGLMTPEMMEIDALLKVKQKREDYYKRRAEKIEAMKKKSEQPILEDIESKPGIKETRMTPTIDPESRVKRDEKGYM